MAVVQNSEQNYDNADEVRVIRTKYCLSIIRIFALSFGIFYTKRKAHNSSEVIYADKKIEQK